MMAIVRPTIRSLAPADIATVVEFSLRARAPVFESFRNVLGERVYQALYPDWTTSQARDVEAICQDDTATVWVAEQSSVDNCFRDQAVTNAAQLVDLLRGADVSAVSPGG